MYFLVMSQHTIHYDMNINELRQCCFDSGASLTVSLISMASVVQFCLFYKKYIDFNMPMHYTHSGTISLY